MNSKDMGSLSLAFAVKMKAECWDTCVPTIPIQ